ncbi:MAG: type II toxin-antitoxin system HicA family toxin [Pseudomonadota bacterium]
MESNSKAVIKRLTKEGFELVTIRSSHHKYRKGGRTIIVPHPEKDLPKGTARAIANAAGWI